MQKLLEVLKTNFNRYSMVIALVIMLILFQFLTGGILLRPLNITNLILQNSYILILAIGMVLVIIAGHIDLSVGSIAAFVGAIAGILIVNMHMPTYLTVLICLLIGAIIGAWQGFWVAYVNIPAFIVTLAGMLLFRGLTMLVLKGQTIAPFPNEFRSISTGFIPDFFDGSTINITSILLGILFSIIFVILSVKARKNKIKYNFKVASAGVFYSQQLIAVLLIMGFCYLFATYEGIPYILIILLALIVFYTFITNRTIIGRHIYATGGNLKAAMLSGVKTKAVTFWVFVNMGILSALSGLVFASRLNAATPKAGNLFELDAIAASFIGGASAYGGVGTVPGAIVGGLVMGVLNNGMSILGLGIDWQQAIKGVVLLLAVAFDVFNKRRAS
ncbi:multiple monosaccharide ABC transporter permease [Caldibacillus debilis]|uniref:Xylose transport system permease protein XylH n=1 Tax=Caldibacillus debilis TaxID=301148 RepID=A0A150LS98_9BACI|nr:multiple monosaccharide ABC transporter permease [Caldibacillus debilis]KYD15165.1 hypothetical protein B4135_2733 [Caldibacillus debilis]